MFYDSKKIMWKFPQKMPPKLQWTRLCDAAGTEWELPEDDALTSKYVGAIYKEQYNTLSVKRVYVCLLYTYSARLRYHW